VKDWGSVGFGAVGFSSQPGGVRDSGRNQREPAEGKKEKGIVGG